MRKLTLGALGVGAITAVAAVCLAATAAGTAGAVTTHTAQTWHGRAIAHASSPTAVGTGLAARSQDADKTIRYVAHQTEFTFFDLGNDDFGPGDYFLFLARDRSGSTVIGHDTVVCHINFGDATNCTGTTVLSNGQIVTAGEVPASDRWTLPIVGGTGAYKNAKGEATFHALNDTDVAVTLKLS